MKPLSRILVFTLILNLLVVCPVLAQEKQSQDTDLIRAKIEQFEKTDISSKSASVQNIYKRTLLRLYSQFSAALQQDIVDLKAMQAAVGGTNAESQKEIARQIQKLTQEMSETAEKVQTLKGDLQSAVVPDAPVSEPAPSVAQPKTTLASYTPPADNARPADSAIPVLDTLNAGNSPKPVPGLEVPARSYDNMTIKEQCRQKREVEEANSLETDPAKKEHIPIKIALLCPNSGITGLLVGGVVVSQQEKNFSQADPFFGFTAGYNTDTGRGGWVYHFRIQGIFQSQPQTAIAPKAATASTSPTPTPTPTPTPSAAPTPVDISNFTPFLASRKTFDIDFHMWADTPLGRRVIRIGPYFGIGASTFIDSNELKGDETVTKTDASGGETKLDPTLGRASNDLKKYIEGGLIANLLKDNGELFMQTQMLYGQYEALAGLVPGHDTRNRFVGRLRIFPTGLNLSVGDPNKDSGMSMSPMFGVELNAGRGPDQLKFFTGIAISIRRFKPFAKEETTTAPSGTPGTTTPAKSGTGSGSTFQ
jgi:hypothetical protein